LDLAKIWQQVGESQKKQSVVGNSKRTKKGVLESHTPLTSSHDDVSKNQQYTEIKLTVLIVPSTRYRRFCPVFHHIDYVGVPGGRV
jgi:hypothetical protein